MRDQAFCYITDLHLTEKRPRFRKDRDYLGAQLNVLKQVTDECRKRNIRTIICGGDIMNVYNEFSWRMVNEIRDVFRGFDVYTIIGNHDVPGGNLDRLDWSTVGLLLESGIIKPLSAVGAHVIGTIFTAADWESAEAMALQSNTLLPPTKEYPVYRGRKSIFVASTTVLVAHASIGPKRTQYCIGVEDIDPPYDYCLLGDIHDGHDTYVSPRGCRIINPGSLGISSQKDANRPPRCVFIWPHEKREEYVELRFDEDQGFDKKRIAEYQSAKAAKFTRALAQAKAKKKGLTGASLVKEVGKKGKFSECQINLLLSEMSAN